MEIGKWAFDDCESLKEINIPTSLIKIEAGLFKGILLENIELPKTLTEVGKEAFYGTKFFCLTSENYTLTLPVPSNRHKIENDSCNEKNPPIYHRKRSRQEVGDCRQHEESAAQAYALGLHGSGV